MTTIKTKYRLLRLHEIQRDEMFSVELHDGSDYCYGPVYRVYKEFDSKTEALEYIVENNMRGDYTLLETYSCSEE